MLEEAFLPLEILMLQLCEKSQRSNEAASHWPHTPDQSYIHRGHRVTPNLPGPYWEDLAFMDEQSNPSSLVE